MITLKELNEWFEDLSKITSDLNIALNNLKGLSNMSEDEIIERFRTTNGFFVHHRFQLRFVLVVQLSKIFSNSPQQKRRIRLLMRNLMVEDYDEDLINQLDSNKQVLSFQIGNEIRPIVFKTKDDIIKEINIFNKRLKDSRKLIEKVENARNKIYAHSDPFIEMDIPLIQLDEFEKLVLMANDFYNIFRGRLINAHLSFNMPDWDVMSVLKLIVRLQRRLEIK